MIKQTNSQGFIRDLESVLDWLCLKAIEDGKDIERFELEFKRELIQVVSRITENPFIYSSYGPSNPTRRAVLYHGNYIVEYQLLPSYSMDKEMVDEVIFTSLLPARSNKYSGAYEEFDFEDLFDE